MAMGANLIARLGLDTAQFQRGLKSADTAFGKFRKKMSGLYGLGATAGLTALTNQAIQMASRIDDASKKLGVGAEFLQAFGFAARETGVKTEAAEMGLQRFSRRVGEARQGLGELKGVLEQYNISLTNADGTARDITDVLRDYANVIRDTEDPQERLRLAFKAFDSEGAGLVTMLKDGADGLDAWIGKARDANQVMGEETVQSLAKAENAMERFGVTAQIAIGTALSKFMDYGDFLGRFYGRIYDFAFGPDQLSPQEIEQQEAEFKKRRAAVLKMFDAEIKAAEDAQVESEKAARVQRARQESAGKSLELADIFTAARNALGYTEQDLTNAEKRLEVLEIVERKIDEERTWLREQFDEEYQIAQLRSEINDAETEKLLEQRSMLAELTDKMKGLAREANIIVDQARNEIERQDAGKRTLQEIASIGRFEAGTSIAASEQGAQAREAMELRKRAEEARLRGDAEQFNELKGQSDAITEALFREGALKSSEVSEDLVNDLARENAQNRLNEISIEATKTNDKLDKIIEIEKAKGAYT